ncbi:MAG: zinc-ribbon domain-containing protein [Rhodocyclaceae bacterium]|nr:zinc-ribbon domain-containing protein [Rhodocyclaceae bacterium]
MMMTRCPDCGTAFRVVPAQLKARQGRVRCGHCMASFDALASLAEDAGEMPPTVEAGAIAADITAPCPEVVPPSSDAVDAQPPDDRLEPTVAPAAELAAVAPVPARRRPNHRRSSHRQPRPRRRRSPNRGCTRYRRAGAAGLGWSVARWRWPRCRCRLPCISARR